MKKSTILLVTVVYFASIIFIIFFGVRMVTLHQLIPAVFVEFYQVETSERIIHADGEVFDRIQDGTPYGTKTIIVRTSQMGLNADGNFVIYLRWRFLPYYATETDMNVTTLASRERVQIINDRQQMLAQIVFIDGVPTSARITITAPGATTAQDEIHIVFVN